MKRRNFLKLGTGAAIGGALAACGGGGGSPGGRPVQPPPAEPVRTKVVIAWNNVALAAIRATRSGAPMGARSLANAVFDAGIAAWDAKRFYDSSRPVTAIRHLMNGQTIRGFGLEGPAAGLKQIQGEAWVPYQLSTFFGPPFAEHVSGHNADSMAAAEVLKRFTGSDAFNHSVTMPARSMLYDPSLPVGAVTLRWDTFFYAACEAGHSRVYGGIHFENADKGGRALGSQVGQLVFEKAQGYWQGTLPG